MALLFLAFLFLVIWVVKLQDRVRDLEQRDEERLSVLRTLAEQVRELTPQRTPGQAVSTRPPVEAASPRREPAPPPAVEGPAAAAAQPLPVPVLPAVPRAHPNPDSPPPSRPFLEPSVAAALPPAPATAPPPVPPGASPLDAPPPSSPFDWETLVGVKLFSWIAGVALALAAIFFLGYSIQNGWLQPPVRMAIGILVGLGLLVACETKIARNYAVTANAMDAAGIVTLFSTFFASYALWHLLGPATTFTLLVLVTLVAVALSIRRDSVFVALLGLVGGFSTPALLSSGQNDPLGLFGYLLLLNAGLAWVAYRKRWVVLSALSVLFTTMYQWGWTMTFLAPDGLALAGAIFLVFPLLGVLALAAWGPRGEDRDGTRSTFRLLTAANAALPLLFAVFASAVPAYGEHFWILFGFLLCVDAGLLAMAAWRGPQALHLLGAGSTLIVWFVWLGNAYSQPEATAAWPAVLGLVAIFVVFYLVTGCMARHGARRIAAPATFAVYAAPMLLVAFPVLAANEPAFASPALGFSVLFALLSLIAAYAILEEAGPVYFIAALVALTTEGVWSGLHLDADRLLAALMLYLVFGLFYLGVPLLARRGNRARRPGDSGSEAAQHAGFGFALVAHLFLGFVAAQPSLALPPWPMFGVLALLDLAIGVAALYVRRAEGHLCAIVLSLFILILWVLTAGASPWPLIASLAASGVAAFALAWSYLARRRTNGRPLELFDAAAAGGLVLAQGLIVVASFTAGAPGVRVLALFHVVFAVALLSLATLTAWPALSVIAVLAPWFATWAWLAVHPTPWAQALEFATPIYLVFLAYPVVLGRWAGRRIEPHLAAVLASAAFFHVARASLAAGGYGGVIGALPVAQAILLGVLLVALLRIERPGERALGRLALVAGAVLAFITVAIPLQLEKEWVTIGWALEGAALAWLFGRIPHRGLYWSALALFAVVFVRLALNPEVLVYQPRGSLRILNWYLYTYLVCAGAMVAGGWLLSRTADEPAAGVLRASQVGQAAATVLLFLLLNIEIADYFSAGPSITFNLSAGLAQDLTYTLGWGVFAVSLLVVGIALRSPFARMSAIALLTVTVLKGFLHDMARLGGLYRVFSFVGLAICLALVALALQRFVLRRKGGALQ